MEEINKAENISKLPMIYFLPSNLNQLILHNYLSKTNQNFNNLISTNDN